MVVPAVTGMMEHDVFESTASRAVFPGDVGHLHGERIEGHGTHNEMNAKSRPLIPGRECLKRGGMWPADHTANADERFTPIERLSRRRDHDRNCILRRWL